MARKKITQKKVKEIFGILAGCPWKEYKNGDISIRMDKDAFNELFHSGKYYNSKSSI